MEVGQQAELQVECVQLALEALLVRFSHCLQGKGSDGNPILHNDEATFILA